MIRSFVSFILLLSLFNLPLSSAANHTQEIAKPKDKNLIYHHASPSANFSWLHALNSERTREDQERQEARQRAKRERIVTTRGRLNDSDGRSRIWCHSSPAEKWLRCNCQICSTYRNREAWLETEGKLPPTREENSICSSRQRNERGILNN